MRYFSIILFLLVTFISYGQDYSSKILHDITNGGMFSNSKRDKQFEHRLKEILIKEKIDTVLILSNRYLNIKDSIPSLKWDNREYLIYKKRGKVYVDYFYYIHWHDGFAEKFKSSLENNFNAGDKIFKYFINNKIDTVKSAFNFDPNNRVDDDTRGCGGYINIGKYFYVIGYILTYRVSEIKGDPRLIFYQYIMQCLRKEGY